MNRRTLLTLTAAALAAAAAAAARPANADDTLSLAIGQKGSWDEMVAQQGVDEGFFKRAGLDLKLAYTAGGSDTIQAVTTGSADMGFGIGTTAVIASFAKGAPIKIVSASFTGAGDFYYYAKADSPINKFGDLNGKTVGFTRPGSSSFTIAHVLAEQEHVTPTFVSTGEFPATYTQVMSGQIDAGFSVVPLFLDQVAQKKIKIIARGSDAKALQNQTIRVDIASDTALRAHRDALVRFWRAYAATKDWMYKNLDKAVANFARYNDMTLDAAKVVVPYYPPHAIALYPVSDFDRSISDAVDQKFIPAPLTPDQQKAIFDILAPH
jgi:NitT/TauT family transport system substrate-binding protein